MESNSKNLRDIESVQLSDTITSIDATVQHVAVGCLDNSVSVWAKAGNSYALGNTLFTSQCNAMGVIDLSFNKNSTILASSCMDSTIRIIDIHTQQVSTIECEVMQNWKLQCIDQQIITAGDYGRVCYYDITSKERIDKKALGQIFITALAVTEKGDRDFTAVGNNSGQVHIINKTNNNKERVLKLRPHYKLVRDIAFIENDSKLLTSSDDGTVKMIDIASQNVVQTFEGHKQGVTSVNSYEKDSSVFLTTSFDKTVKIWDLRSKACVGTAITGCPLWDCKPVGNKVLAGGDNGILFVYSME